MIEEEKRRFIQKLGFKLLRDVNACSVAGATSISATVLLSGPNRGTRYDDYARLANAVAKLVKAQGVKTTASLDRNIGDFRESLDFLAKSGLIDRIRRGNDEIIVVRENKRLALDFYKNNLIHAFVLPSLICSAMLDGKRGDALIEEVQRWLDVFRYEFALPARHELGGEIEKSLARLRGLGALQDDQVDAAHPVVVATIAALNVFRESYWLTVKTVREVMASDGSTEKALVSEYQKAYEAALLVGEAVQPEGATMVLFQNAVSRLIELEYVQSEKRGRGGRERAYLPGTRWPELEAYEEELRRAVLRGRAVWPRPV